MPKLRMIKIMPGESEFLKFLVRWSEVRWSEVRWWVSDGQWSSRRFLA